MTTALLVIEVDLNTMPKDAQAVACDALEEKGIEARPASAEDIMSRVTLEAKDVSRYLKDTIQRAVNTGALELYQGAGAEAPNEEDAREWAARYVRRNPPELRPLYTAQILSGFDPSDDVQALEEPLIRELTPKIVREWELRVVSDRY